MPHGFGGGSKEMSPAGKPARLVPGQAQPGLVNQGRGLEGVTRSLADHLERGQFAQFLINQRKQFVCGCGIAVSQAVEHARDVAHSQEVSSDFRCLQRSGLDPGASFDQPGCIMRDDS
jgi:hypothetical protein